ncbi:MAG: spore maturation protein [Clostridia bacterium]|nr:MAG: spore maturation protein [Clostridia bacterium]
MVNLIWLLLLAGGGVAAVINGNVAVVTQAAFTAATDAVQIAFELVGLMALWLGLLKIAEDAGLVALLARAVHPLMRRLFPSIPRHHPALGAILMNLTASLLGLGNAATPFGLKAMQEMQRLNPNPDEASEAMCTFLALNTSCITLIPATVIGLRAAAGSVNPAEIVGPTILATTCGTVAAIIADQFLRRYYRWRG